ncbi:Sperm-associated antigen 1A [Bienertia sinuspersici]
MNSNYGKTGTSFDFDLGIGSNRSRSLNDQKNKSNNSNSFMTSSSTSSFSQPKPASTTPSWQPGKPSWTHQPAPSNSGLTRSELGGPSSMVGDILGKSWNSTKPATGQPANIGVVNKNPNLFGDLVSSALGPNKGSSSNVPLKNAALVKSSFSLGGMADSLPKTSNNISNSNVGKNGNVGLGSSPGYGSFGGVATSGSSVYGNNGMAKSSSVGGNSMRNLGGGSTGVGVGMSSSKDPFVSLVDFSSKPMGGGSLYPSSKATASTSSEDFGFGDFQNAPKSNASTTIPSGNANSNLWGSNAGSVPNMDNFVTQNPAPAQSTGGDSFDMFFSSATNVGGGAAAIASDNVVGGQQFSGGDDWGMDSNFCGGHDEGNTTEIEGLPPPPAGVSASSAKAKGLDNYKQGQFADAIKWLSWAEILIEKAGDASGTMEVLTCRASCYKEVGEYKKAVADCTKPAFCEKKRWSASPVTGQEQPLGFLVTTHLVKPTHLMILDRDEENVSVLVQRALLYESMEKYRLGADDLRTVMKIDPGNRLARSTIHRLNKMAD